MDGVEYASVQNIVDTYDVFVNVMSTGEFTLCSVSRRPGSPAIVFTYLHMNVEKGTLAERELTPADISSSTMLPLEAASNGITSIIDPANRSAQSSLGNTVQPVIPFASAAAVTIAILAVTTKILIIVRRKQGTVFSQSKS